MEVSVPVPSSEGADVGAVVMELVAVGVSESVPVPVSVSSSSEQAGVRERAKPTIAAQVLNFMTIEGF